MTDGTTAGSCTVVNRRTPLQPEGAAGLDELAVDVPQGGGDDRVDGEERADRDEDDLRLLADA